ncbi:hypothetical protein CLU97_2447 [Chryseobacterium sp. 7]|uniref:hypothetical protein n=1 Tax=Chryseobacterium sp. 7 TaxID=2035214 RepID=UPI000EB073AA|nr:hypothetical protein [Chryseobacterium sp. 7]RLJ32976.1 hypothetical protein CLU97_2447 [Chryseobacterium sp. 7]
MKKEKIILSSTHMDSQNTVMLESALYSALPSINGDRKPRLGVEHIRTFPPLGVLNNGEVKQGNDGHFYLIAENYFFDKREYLELENGERLIMESFNEYEFPFNECGEEELNKILISVDPSNFDNPKDINDFFNDINDSELDTDKEFHGRKSLIPDPEIIISIQTVIAVALGIGLKKIPEKMGDAIGEDLVKFYNLLKKVSAEALKKSIPKNRPNNFVIIYPNKKCIIELVVTTKSADLVLESVLPDKMKDINEKIKILLKLKPEKIQFIFEENKWLFNYLLTENGKVIGREKSFNDRDETYANLLRKQS